MIHKEIPIADFDYHLPAEQIASHPLVKRDASRLLVYKSGEITNDVFFQLPRHLPGTSLLVLNNTKVIQARLLFTKESGGTIEIFCLEPCGQSMEAALQQTGSAQWKCLVGGASKWKPGQVLAKKLTIHKSSATLQAAYSSKADDGFVIQFSWTPMQHHFADILEAAGAVPLPPYIKRQAEEEDAERYQTIFGNRKGSVAAPTAALHFTKEVFAGLQEKSIDVASVTLHVGAGTFKPVKSATAAGHLMHGEDFTITKEVLEKLIRAEKIIAGGTTSLRTLESIYWLGVKLMNGTLNDTWVLDQWEVYNMDDGAPYKESLAALAAWMNRHSQDTLHCRTSLLIVPGYRFKIPCGLITNFHQPQSTLLLLVAAFIGSDWRKVYDHALEQGYRFLSYGDSSLLWRNDNDVH